ncbi:hypothetical protein [Pseudonocardia alaniniphila]|uniref:Uncharacterized protein n=1 Tax=Pseudonocardia alaniniphila TaxID=75291 RepID=A0ABS9TN78_9PSEU|nr:hypothetical protein [Pseudonocardia alaniniphila]MCH6169968.1 hypothetical protein [Pseudonocardia alaniniphila]
MGVDLKADLPYAGLQRLCTSMVGRLEGLPGPQQDALRIAFGLRDGAQLAPQAPGRPAGLLLDGLTTWFTEGCATALPPWLRREGRRSAAREHLSDAHDAFREMGRGRVRRACPPGVAGLL